MLPQSAGAYNGVENPVVKLLPNLTRIAHVSLPIGGRAVDWVNLFSENINSSGRALAFLGHSRPAMDCQPAGDGPVAAIWVS